MTSFYDYIHHKNIACYKLVSDNGFFSSIKIWNEYLIHCIAWTKIDVCPHSPIAARLAALVLKPRNLLQNFECIQLNT